MTLKSLPSTHKGDTWGIRAPEYSPRNTWAGVRYPGRFLSRSFSVSTTAEPVPDILRFRFTFLGQPSSKQG